MRLHQRVRFQGAEWEYLETVSNGIILKSLNKNIENRLVETKYLDKVTLI